MSFSTTQFVAIDQLLSLYWDFISYTRERIYELAQNFCQDEEFF